MKEITYGQFKHMEDDTWWEAKCRDKKAFADVLQCHLFRLGIMVKNRKLKTLRQARKEAFQRKVDYRDVA